MIFCTSEEDAKTKWCPMARNTFEHQTVNCIASACMAWRWVETHVKDADGNLTVVSGDTHGYCGLAGKEWRKT